MAEDTKTIIRLIYRLAKAESCITNAFRSIKLSDLVRDMEKEFGQEMLNPEARDEQRS